MWEDSITILMDLILCVQNVCVEQILIFLNPILAEFVMMLVAPQQNL